jgi:hypothetical protein
MYSTRFVPVRSKDILARSKLLIEPADLHKSLNLGKIGTRYTCSGIPDLLPSSSATHNMDSQRLIYFVQAVYLVRRTVGAGTSFTRTTIHSRANRTRYRNSQSLLSTYVRLLLCSSVWMQRQRRPITQDRILEHSKDDAARVFASSDDPSSRRCGRQMTVSTQ